MVTVADNHSPLEWAFIGDALYNLKIKEWIVQNHTMQVQKLHLKAAHFVNANFQCELLNRIYDKLDEKEQKIVKRCQNTKNYHTPKGVSKDVYAKSTALEGVIGYYVFNKDYENIDRIFGYIYDVIQDEI